MAAINPIGSTTTGATTAANPSSSMMDKDTFLKLLVEQLRHQDPTAPADSSQWTAQMAQFSTVEQLTNLTKSTTQSAKSAAMTQAVGLLGRTVYYLQDDAAVQRAAAKGARESVVLVDGTAFVVSVRNRTVITAVDAQHMREHVFTNIDSAVIG